MSDHLPFVSIERAEITGVGMYVHLVYDQTTPENLNKLPSTSWSTNENIEIRGLEYGLGYEINNTNGKLDFMEFFTYGESWDGIIPDDFRIMPSEF